MLNYKDYSEEEIRGFEEKGIRLLEERIIPYEERFNSSKWFIIEWVFFGVIMLICLWVTFSKIL